MKKRYYQFTHQYGRNVGSAEMMRGYTEGITILGLTATPSRIRYLSDNQQKHQQNSTKTVERTEGKRRENRVTHIR